MKTLPFSDIKLDRDTYAVLEQLSNGAVKHGGSQMTKLYNYGLARYDHRAEVWLITDEGLQYGDYYKAERHTVRLATRRYWITTVIAIAAFLLAATSLTWQWYTWQVEHATATLVAPISEVEQRELPTGGLEPPGE